MKNRIRILTSRFWKPEPTLKKTGSEPQDFGNRSQPSRKRDQNLKNLETGANPQENGIRTSRIWKLEPTLKKTGSTPLEFGNRSQPSRKTGAEPFGIRIRP